MTRFLTLHAIHALPAGLFNRDETGAIKRITFGGTSRVRISSQSWKRALRVHLRDAAIEGGAFGTRTVTLPKLVADYLAQHYGVDLTEATAKAAPVFTAMGLSANERTGNTAVMVFAPDKAVERIAEAIHPHLADIGGENGVPAAVTEQALAALDPDTEIDVALFGRFLAEIPGRNIDGAVAVSHAFSVDKAGVEDDFFTALDDVTRISNMMGSRDLAAPVLYRHAALDRRQLRENLQRADDPEKLAAIAERSVIDAFVQAVPSAGRTSSAATTLPAVVLAVASDRDTSLATTFANVITGDTVVDTAVTRLVEAADRASKIAPAASQVLLPISSDEHGSTGKCKIVNSVDALAAAALGDL